MKTAISYILYFGGLAYALFNLSEVVVENDKGGFIYRNPEYAAVVIAVSVFVFFVFRDAATFVKGKNDTEE